MNRCDRDILLPEERDPWRILRDLRSLLRRRPRPAVVVESAAPEDLRLAFEYLAAECRSAGTLLENLAEPLAARMAALTGQRRFAVQCKLAEALGDEEPGRFFVALHLATRVPVPQGRGLLLQMLTQGHLARWSFVDVRQASSGNGHLGAFDLRPAVVAALGQLRDPSLLGLFHRLLEKLSGTGAANEAVVAAVQWSLMNLAPGGYGEPMPMMMLTGKMPVSRQDEKCPPAQAAETPARARPPSHVARGSPDRQGGGSAQSGSSPSVTSERNELLADL